MAVTAHLYKNATRTPPTWVTVVNSVLLLLMSSKEQLIDSLPISNAETLEMTGSWYMWVLKAVGIGMAVLAIVLGVKEDKPDTDKP